MKLGKWLLLVVLSMCLWGTSYAQQPHTETNLGDLLIRFCNETGDNNEIIPQKSLMMEAQTEEKKDICIYIVNSGPTDTTVKLNFVDGTITADNSKNKACEPEGTQEQFAQYVSMPGNDRVFHIEAGTTLETHAEVTFPAGYAGMSYGCVTLQIVDDKEEKTSGMFDVLTRRANFVDVFVDGEIVSQLEVIEQTQLPFGNIGTDNKLVVYREPETGKYMVKIAIRNNGNVAQMVSVYPSIHTWRDDTLVGKLKEHKEIVGDAIQVTQELQWGSDLTGDALTRKVVPHSETDFTFSIDDVIPFRQGNVKLGAKLMYSPILEFQSDGLADELKDSKELQLSNQFFIFPWRIILIGICILLLLGIILKRRRNKNK